MVHRPWNQLLQILGAQRWDYLSRRTDYDGKIFSFDDGPQFTLRDCTLKEICSGLQTQFRVMCLNCKLSETDIKSVVSLLYNTSSLDEKLLKS